MNERPEIRAQYNADLELLNEVISGAEMHMENHPDCFAQPVCIGPTNLNSLREMAQLDLDVPWRLIMVAVHEMITLRKRVDYLHSGLTDLGDPESLESAIEQILRGD